MSHKGYLWEPQKGKMVAIASQINQNQRNTLGVGSTS